MRTPIAFVGSIEPAEQAAWVAALAAAMPGERIAPLAACTEHGIDAAEIEVAIVANPDTAALAALPALQWVHSLWAGVERLVQDPALREIPIVRMIDPGMTRGMAEAALAWTMYLHREMPAYARQQRERIWQPRPFVAAADRVVGVLGIGALGTACARLLAGTGFRTLGWSRTPKSIDGVETFCGDDGLARLLAASDILLCLLPLTDATRHLVDAKVLARCRPGAAIMNFARGPVIATGDLIAALDSGHISHAVLDVFDEEPLPADSPLWAHPSITVLPHVTGPTDIESASRVVAQNVRAWRESGVVPSAVSRALGY